MYEITQNRSETTERRSYRFNLSNYFGKLDFGIILSFFYLSLVSAWIFSLMFQIPMQLLDIFIRLYSIYLFLFLILYNALIIFHWKTITFNFLLKRLLICLFLFILFVLPLALLILSFDQYEHQLLSRIVVDMSILIPYYLLFFPILMMLLFKFENLEINNINGIKNLNKQFNMNLIPLNKLINEKEKLENQPYHFLPFFGKYIEIKTNIPIWKFLFFQSIFYFSLIAVHNLSLSFASTANYLFLLTPAYGLLSLSFVGLSISLIYFYFDTRINFSSRQVSSFRLIFNLIMTLLSIVSAFFIYDLGIREIFGLLLLYYIVLNGLYLYYFTEFFPKLSKQLKTSKKFIVNNYITLQQKISVILNKLIGKFSDFIRGALSIPAILLNYIFYKRTLKKLESNKKIMLFVRKFIILQFNDIKGALGKADPQTIRQVVANIIKEDIERLERLLEINNIKTKSRNALLTYTLTLVDPIILDLEVALQEHITDLLLKEKKTPIEVEINKDWIWKGVQKILLQWESSTEILELEDKY